MSPDSLCRWQVQVSIYCAGRLHAHLGCTQCSILLHLIDICFLPCICLWQISQIQTRLCVVVGPGFVSTSPSFMRSSGSAWLACPPKTAYRDVRLLFSCNAHLTTYGRTHMMRKSDKDWVKKCMEFRVEGRSQAIQQLKTIHAFAQHNCIFSMIDLINISPIIKI